MSRPTGMSPGKPYLVQNYKAAVRLLLDQGNVELERAGQRYTPDRGLPDDCVVYFKG